MYVSPHMRIWFSLTWLRNFAVLLYGMFVIGSTYATQTNDAQKEARSIIYWFGEGYATANIHQALPHRVKASKTKFLVRKNTQQKGVLVSWTESPEIPDKLLVESLRVTHQGHLVSDLYIGKTSSAEIRTRFGEPDSSGDDWLTYSGLAEICSDSFTFKFSGGILKEVKWQWCYD